VLEQIDRRRRISDPRRCARHKRFTPADLAQVGLVHKLGEGGLTSEPVFDRFRVSKDANALFARLSLHVARIARQRGLKEAT
jgi:hypothetical protein